MTKPRRTRLRRLRFALDALMATALIAQMCYPFAGDTLHLWIGIAFTTLAIAYIVLNRAWFAQLAQGRWSVPYPVQH